MVPNLEGEARDQNLNSSTSREVESFNQEPQNVQTKSVKKSPENFKSATEKSKEIIDDVRLAVQNYFEDFDKKILRKKQIIMGPEGDGPVIDNYGGFDDSRQGSNESHEHFIEKVSSFLFSL